MQLVRKPARRWLSFWLALSLIFVQIATSAYACMAPVAAAVEAAMPMEDGAPCDGSMQVSGHQLDAEQPGLCLEHCQYGKKARDPGSGPQVPSLQPALVALFTFADAPQAGTSAFSAQTPDRADVPPSPPLSILHCCFRT